MKQILKANELSNPIPIITQMGILQSGYYNWYKWSYKILSVERKYPPKICQRQDSFLVITVYYSWKYWGEEPHDIGFSWHMTKGHETRIILVYWKISGMKGRAVYLRLLHQWEFLWNPLHLWRLSKTIPISSNWMISGRKNANVFA